MSGDERMSQPLTGHATTKSARARAKAGGDVQRVSRRLFNFLRIAARISPGQASLPCDLRPPQSPRHENSRRQELAPAARHWLQE